jgi:hypothetical protein
LTDWIVDRGYQGLIFATGSNAIETNTFEIIQVSAGLMQPQN